MFYKRMQKKLRIIKIAGIALPALVLIVVVGGLSFSILRGGLHLDFSQEYRQVDGVEKIRFRENRYHKMYARTFWGLCPVGKNENSQSKLQDVKKAEDEEAGITWLDMDVYDVSETRERIAWYDWEEEKIFLGDLEGERLCSYDMQYDTVERIVFSPDDKYILFYEKEYGVNGGYSTDEEYCYYRVIDIETGKQYTIYAGYRQWFEVYWE